MPDIDHPFPPLFRQGYHMALSHFLNWLETGENSCLFKGLLPDTANRRLRTLLRHWLQNPTALRVFRDSGGAIWDASALPRKPHKKEDTPCPIPPSAQSPET